MYALLAFGCSSVAVCAPTPGAQRGVWNMISQHLHPHLAAFRQTARTRAVFLIKKRFQGQAN